MAFTRIRLRKALLCGLSVIALAPVLYAGSVEEIKALLDHGLVLRRGRIELNMEGTTTVAVVRDPGANRSND
jgi:hypothetical protein